MGFIRHQVANKVPDRSNLMTSLYYPYVSGMSSSGGGGIPGIGGIDSFTKLMLHMDGDELSTTFTDSALTPKTVTANGNARIQTSGVGKTVTASGDAKISTAKSKIGDSSAIFDGTGDYLSVADSDDWHFWNGDFTLSCWVNLSSVSGLQMLFSQRDSGSSAVQFYLDLRSPTSSIAFNSLNSSAISKGSFNTDNLSWNTNQWYHIEFVRSGNTAYIFRDGISLTVTTITAFASDINNISGNLIIGSRNVSGTFDGFFNGYMDEIEISKGIARHTSNFTPSTTRTIPDTYTKLLLHCDGFNGATTLIDDSAGITPKFGTGLGYFDGNGDYLTVPDSNDWHFTDDFTIDFWVYPSANSTGNRMLFGQAADSFCPVELWWQTDRVIKTYLSFDNATWVTGTAVISSTAIALGAWTHIAFVRSGSTFTFYLNGTQSGLKYNSTSAFTNSTNLLHIAYDTFNGYMDELRISNGIARYTASFTPSTAPYST